MLFVAVDDSPIGLPSDIIPFLRTCSHIHSQLSWTNNKDLYGRMFRIKFDVHAALRRFGPDALFSRNLAEQLQKYCLAMKRIRSGDITAPTVREDLWSAFFMCIENDGRNHAQLMWAGLPRFVDGVLRLSLRSERDTGIGWPKENWVNVLALFLMWATSDYGKSRRSFKTLDRPSSLTA